MVRTKLGFKKIYKIVKDILEIMEIDLSSQTGRKKKYSDALIITMFLRQTLMNYSYREVIYEAKEFFEEVPVVSNYYYRVKTLPKTLLKIILKKLSKILLEEKEVKYIITDGTGFSFNDIYPIKYLRGLEIKEVKNHIRILPTIAITEDNKRIVLCAEEDRAYASEIKMLERTFKNIDLSKFKGKPFIADKGFDSNRVIEKIIEFGLKPAIRVKETFRYPVKSKLRKMSKRNWSKWGRYRFLIESLFGSVKQKLDSNFRVKNQEIAEKMGLAVFVLYNMYLLIIFFLFLFIYFTLLFSNISSF